MTICIAASCDGGKKCVVSADREVTAQSLSLEFEHEKKIDVIGQSCVVMASGDSLLADEVSERTRRRVSIEGLSTIQQIAEALADVYLQCHLARAEGVILRPHGWTWTTYQQEGAQRIPTQVYMQIDSQLWNFGINVAEFLVAGVDESGAHIFRVHYEGMPGGGWLEWCDRLGYRAIGSGGPHASILLALQGQRRTLPVGETIFNVYSAKKNAEIAPGVGLETDVAVIEAGKIAFLDINAFGKLEGLRKELTAARKVSPEKVKDVYA